MMKNKEDISKEEIQQLWQAFRKGSHTAFSDIYQLYQNNLFNYGLRIFANKDLVEDVIQDVFVELWKKRQKLGKINSVKHYLLIVLKRRMIDKLRKNNFQDTSLEDSSQYNFELEISPESVFIDAENSSQRKERIDQALAELSNREKEVIYLRFFDELSYDEIAEIMNIQKKTAYNLLNTALNKLRNNLDPHTFSLFLYLTLPHHTTLFQ